ncbi:serine/threonine protein kinase [Micromonospora sp. NBC_01655]|uniref:serine/threonine-protein kinase n=1 Tax=Micromonospora sp. NBC_01655 TaxID=2975983 RepID=UPI00225A2F0D|nr:serine/threonine-protein kinase [Micromonospora sp. NBC_01655]MCX4472869.1 serine/threonine protein kinase [Micromonospora sp. NBC_01655]
MSPLTPGLRLHDRYVLRERIGLGGMSEVWRADDEVLHRPVAVKALAGQPAADPQLRATIQREARAAARLTHPHVTQVYDYGEAALAAGTVLPYLVMELVDGHSLADRLTAGPLPWPEAVRVAGQVAAALAAAHRIGVVHQDVKPGNVMLTETGAKVLDFGIAALAGPRHPLAGSPGGQTGELVMGTPAYFAPERMSPGPPNPASDVYALGALLYQSLTGATPLPVQTWEDAVEVHARRPPVSPPRVTGLPPDIAALTLACLDADPARRPTTAELAARLGAAPPAEPPTALLPVVPRAAPHPPTMVDRATRFTPGRATRSTSPSAASPFSASPSAASPFSASASPSAASWPGASSDAPPGRSRRGNRSLGVLLAAGVALLVGLIGLLVLDDDSATPPAAAPGATTAAPRPTAASAARTTTAPIPVPSTTARNRPASLRELAAEFIAVVDEAQARGEIDRKTANELRDKAEELNRGKPKDRVKRLADLRERVIEAAERDRIGAAVVNRLRDLLTGYGQVRGDEDD